MKIETPIGIGEIVIIKLLDDNSKRARQHDDKKSGHSKTRVEDLGKVGAIMIESDGGAKYRVSYRNECGQDQILWFTENELEGDPDFDQETLTYADEFAI